MAIKYKQCPHCKRDIADDAKKCHHCGAWISRSRRIYSGLISATPLLTILVLGFMICQTNIMKYTIKQGQESINALQRLTIKADSSLSLDIQDLAIRIEQKELDAKRVKISEEQSSPKIQIRTPIITVSDSGLNIYTDIGNTGSLDAESVVILFTYKIPLSVQDTLTFMYELNRMAAGYRKNFENFIKMVSPLKWDFYSKINVKYKSPVFEGVLSDRKYFEHTYHKDTQNFSTKTLDEIQSKKLAKKIGF